MGIKTDTIRDGPSLLLTNKCKTGVASALIGWHFNMAGTG